MANWANLKEEVRERRKFGFYAKAGFKRWKAKRLEMEVALEQPDGMPALYLAT